jgi:hypothetical protein
MIPLMEQYHESLEKLALALESVQMAKSFLIEMEGIGQDLPATLMGWFDDRIAVMIQAGEEHANDTPMQRIADISSIALIAKGGWLCESMTLVLEGYCSLTEDTMDERPLNEAFVDNPAVSECLTFVHVDKGDDPIIAVSPYSVGLGRVTSFSKPKFSNKEPFRSHFEPLMKALAHERGASSVPVRRRHDAATELIGQLGWSVLNHDEV